ncbi:hypothetical protein PTH_1929 [Pelotomaculum thermopropionicum SI]|uniref:Uncharacterized protein n=1 Tax=Pelotomaculum thermopropionicum (strain DSM 13744 / JCM 10971 / SI) TaxID=370438 RepID=A5D0V6_PELTS|nr:hypothetical protein PTH_1929 [Pelotomaculum thermopropionicum SI]
MFLVLINFSHPFTYEQLRQLEEFVQKKVERVIEVSAQIDPQQPIVPQIVAMADRTGLTPQEWQTTPLIVNPPSLSISAVTLLAELHGRCGYFPAVVRLRPVTNSVPPQFEMAEIVNLQAVREESRKGR